MKCKQVQRIGNMLRTDTFRKEKFQSNIYKFPKLNSKGNNWLKKRRERATKETEKQNESEGRAQIN